MAARLQDRAGSGKEEGKEGKWWSDKIYATPALQHHREMFRRSDAGEDAAGAAMRRFRGIWVVLQGRGSGGVWSGRRWDRGGADIGEARWCFGDRGHWEGIRRDWRSPPLSRTTGTVSSITHLPAGPQAPHLLFSPS